MPSVYHRIFPYKLGILLCIGNIIFDFGPHVKVNRNNLWFNFNLLEYSDFLHLEIVFLSDKFSLFADFLYLQNYKIVFCRTFQVRIDNINHMRILYGTGEINFRPIDMENGSYPNYRICIF